MSIAKIIGIDAVISRINPECQWRDVFNDLEDPRTQASLEALIKAADGFLRAGGQITLDDWQKLTHAERAAFIAAGDKATINKAIMIGKAIRSEEGMFDLAAQVDGGKLQDEYLFDAAVQVCADKYNKVVLNP